MGRNRLELFCGVGQAVCPCQYAMPGSPLLYSSVVPADEIPVEKSRSQGVEELRSCEAKPKTLGPDTGGFSLFDSRLSTSRLEFDGTKRECL